MMELLSLNVLELKYFVSCAVPGKRVGLPQLGSCRNGCKMSDGRIYGVKMD